MTTVSVVFGNSNDERIMIQVEPYCVLYVLEKGEKIEFVVESSGNAPRIDIQEDGNLRIVYLNGDMDEYDVVLNGQRVNWKNSFDLIDNWCIGKRSSSGNLNET